MKRKATSSIFATIAAIVLVAATTSGLLGCVTPASKYTEEEHIARVTRRARERFIDNGEYTDLEVFPLYDANDELGYFLIELQPSGYAYVEMNRSENVNDNFPMYVVDVNANVRWARIVYDPDNDVIFTDDENKPVQDFRNRRFTELDESGNPIYYKESHFKVAGIKDEKRYLLETLYRNGYIPAVKRDGEFINLVSMETYDDNSSKDQTITALIGFGAKRL